MNATVLSLRAVLIPVVGLLMLTSGLLLMPQSVSAAPDTIITVAAAAGGSTDPEQLRDPKVGDTVQNGDFTIVYTGGNDAALLGNGIDENTEWTFDFTKDPNWPDFSLGNLRSALLTLALIPKDGTISTDVIRPGDLPLIGEDKDEGGVSPFMYPPLQALPEDVVSVIEVELLSFYTRDDLIGAIQEGKLPMLYGDDAIVVFAHLKLVATAP